MSLAVKRLQEKIGAKVDGEFGPKTLRAAAKYYGLTNAQAAHFFGQIAHETSNFRHFEENLNYSREGLFRVFKKYFNDHKSAEPYAWNPTAIANKVYGGRMGNGPPESGDGWKFRGRGAIQLTGKENYEAFAQHLKMPEILDSPDLVSYEYPFESALFYFKHKDIFKYCNEVNDNNILHVTKLINGAFNGLVDRMNKTKLYYTYLKMT